MQLFSHILDLWLLESADVEATDMEDQVFYYLPAFTLHYARLTEPPVGVPQVLGACGCP
jgi:hypothetical protein